MAITREMSRKTLDELADALAQAGFIVEVEQNGGASMGIYRTLLGGNQQYGGSIKLNEGRLALNIEKGASEEEVYSKLAGIALTYAEQNSDLDVEINFRKSAEYCGKKAEETFFSSNPWW